MALAPDYTCTRCGMPTRKTLLTAKKAVFQLIGARGKVIRSRTTDWLCPRCVNKDNDYNRDISDSPGYQKDNKPAVSCG